MQILDNLIIFGFVYNWEKNPFAKKYIVLSKSDAEPPRHSYGVELVTLKK